MARQKREPREAEQTMEEADVANGEGDPGDARPRKGRDADAGGDSSADPSTTASAEMDTSRSRGPGANPSASGG